MLVLLVLALAGTVRAEPGPAAAAGQDDLREARSRAARAAEAKDWAGCESAYRDAASIAAARALAHPDDFDIAMARDAMEYNAACCAALGGRSDEAFALLDGLLDRAWYDNDELLEEDADLASLRLDAPRFSALLARRRAVLDAATAGHAEGAILVPSGRRLDRGRLPLIVALHGGGGNIEGWRDAWHQVADHAGAVVVLVRGTRVQGAGAFSYHQTRPASDLARIDAWIARARREIPASAGGDTFLSGFSQGGGMAWVLGITADRPWRGIIPIGGYVQIAAREAVMAEPVRRLAAFAIVGEGDEQAIREVNARLAAPRGLKNLRARLEIVEGMGHGLPPDLPRRIARAMRWCRGAGAAVRGDAEASRTRGW